MYDPITSAFDIKSPFRHAPDKFWPNGYRDTLITIWHVDPQDSRGMCVRRNDDTCGWFTPPYPMEAHDRIRKLGESQYSTIFEKQWAIAEGKDYTNICYEPNTYDTIYWAWRAIKHVEHKSGGWIYGKRLNLNELEYIYSLASNPTDNLRMTVSCVKDVETCADFFITVYHSYLRFNRPWYRHPRWHFWHWRLQIHLWQKFRRWKFSRCASCGKGFSWGYSPVSHSWDRKRLKVFRSEEGVYHTECSDIDHRPSTK